MTKKFTFSKMKTTLITLIILMIKLSQAKECSKDQVLLNGECRNLVNFHNKCTSTRMCRTKNAICLDENNKEHNFNSDSLDIEREAYCQCPFRYEFSPQKDECLNFRRFCRDNSTCEKNYDCVYGLCKCIYEDDKNRYYTHCLQQQQQELNVVTCYKDPVRTICTNNTQRYDLPDPFMINQTWTSMMWKLSFLTVFLILLMLLIKGVLRARQNDEFLNYARTIALHQEAIRNDNIHRSNRDISVNIQHELPPSYDDCVKFTCNRNQAERLNHSNERQTSI